LTHSESLELVGKTLGFHDLNTLAAWIRSEAKLPDTKPGSSPPGDKPVRQEIAVDATILDGYVGFFQHTDTQIMTPTRDATQLLSQLSGQCSVPLYTQSKTEFFAKVVDAQISLLKDP
jgi:hypothetical protein